MKRTLIYCLIILALCSACNLAFASKFLSPKSPGFEIDTVYNDDTFLSGGKIKFDSKVYGDLFSLSSEMVQTDSILGNFMAVAGSVQNLGPVTGSYRAVGWSLSCNSSTGRNLLLCGKDISIGPRAHIGRDADICGLFGGNVVFQGSVEGNLNIRARSAVVSGHIGADLFYAGDSLTVNPNTVIGGNLSYTSANRAVIGVGAVIKGQTEWKKDETKKPSAKPENGTWKALTKWIISLRGYGLYLILIWLIILSAGFLPIPSGLVLAFFWVVLGFSGNILVLLTKHRARATENVLRQKLFQSMGVGFIGFFLTPVIAFILFFIILTSPLAVLLLMLYGIALFGGGIYACLYLGRQICRLFGSINTPGYLCFTIGMTVLSALSLIPVVGYLLVILVLMTGLGGLVQSFMGSQQTTNLPIA